MMFASSGSSGAGSGRGGGPDDDYGYEDDYADEPMDEPEPEEPRRRPRSTRTVRASGPAAAGNPRVAQHQPEERYWTDYLRIALPVVGLLLMIGLLWFWATQLIGDSPDTTDPEPEEIGLVSQGTPEPAQVQQPQNNTIGIGDPASTPAATTGETTDPVDEPATGDNQADEPADAPADEPAAETDTGALFESADLVVVSDDGLNMRAEPGTAGDPIATLNAGDVLTIISGPVEAEDYIWWEVTTEDGMTTGFVVQDFIEAAE